MQKHKGLKNRIPFRENFHVASLICGMLNHRLRYPLLLLVAVFLGYLILFNPLDESIRSTLQSTAFSKFRIPTNSTEGNFQGVKFENDTVDIELPLIIAGPCLKSNDDYAHKTIKYELYTDNDIANRRRDWQNFLMQEYPRLSSFEGAAEIMASRGLPHMVGKRGIVIALGDVNHFKFLKTGIFLLRKYGCKLSIEVWSFSHELNREVKEKVKELSTLDSEVTLRYADDHLNFLPVARGKGDGYHIKAAAVLNSGFEDLIFLDVDTFVIRNPEYLFDTPEYQQNGALFWPDYWKTPVYSPVWRGQPCVDEWEQESGVLFINKRRSWKAILLLWFLNRDDELRKWHSDFLHGDKDLFRFSWRAAGIPSYFIQTLVAPGGFIVPDLETGEHRFCGISMIQHDTSGQILFAHLNFFKQTNKRNFNLTNLPISVVREYLPLGSEEEPGPMPGSRLAYGATRGAKTGFIGVNEHVCVDLVRGVERDGVVRETQFVEIADLNPEFPIDVFELLAETDLKNYKKEQAAKIEKEKKEKEETERKENDERRKKEEAERKGNDENRKKEEERIAKEKMEKKKSEKEQIDQLIKETEEKERKEREKFEAEEVLRYKALLEFD
ncbi:hypothetical protein HK096_011548, partial [Nowakowskiella sp. JEL0078]